jgi:pimeloyl-ACP methyl ester carboxylesterase
MSTFKSSLDTHIFYKIDDHTDPDFEPQTVVFIHGFCETTEAWRTWVPSFSRQYKVVRYDQRGFGQTGSVSEDFIFTPELIIDDLTRLIHLVSPNKKVHIVSGKSGAMTAIYFASAKPDLVQTLTMVSPAVKGPDTTGWLEHIKEKGMLSWSRWTMRQRLGEKMSEKGLEWWSQLMGQTTTSTALAYLGWVSKVDCTPLFKNIKAPVYILGSETKRRGAKEFQSYVDQIPNATLEMIEVDGYHVGAVVPDLCAQKVKAFIAKH